MSIKRRGFGSMSLERIRQIASVGGKKAHKNGTAYEWSTDEARLAGRLGGLVTARRKRMQKALDALTERS